ncbi:YdcF family protein [Paenibacillus sp. BSR1-1]|uniref:YdcF family protein n=1 Tax=Paenibacillus sp. BSR1-1 TaxID=3020845 RepID=UPI0025B0BFED|nr:YdcF family protein [Paenibacillus sp. BSR1-1]MDN3015204.1 YdcF family protein [Paenibacillus sp. BSR1-1]
MKNKKKGIQLLGLCMALGLIYFVFLQVKIGQYSDVEAPKNADYLIVLGARVKGTVPSLAFASRIESAAIYLTENENTIVIASGGKGPGEDISEAESIKRELIKKGISENRIILEDQSTDTYENIRFSKKLIPKEAKAGIIVTNNFHLYRAISIARDNDLEVKGIPAKTPLIAVPKSYTREYLAITKFYLKKYILDSI